MVVSQVENFGLHVNVDGSVLYGINVEAIMDRKDDDISLDMLSRMLVDVHQDSSSIMNDLLSKYQQALMDMYVRAIHRFSCGPLREPV